MEKRKEKLGGYLKVSYGLADLGFIFMVTMSNTYLLMFYTDVAGITAAAAGTLMMVEKILFSEYQEAQFLIPYENGNVVHYLNSRAMVHSREFQENGVCLTVSCREGDREKYKQYLTR